MLENLVFFVIGFDVGIVNLGEVENKGWEFELRMINIVCVDFNWSSILIVFINENILLSFGEFNG